jgi:hypothetical protein
MISMVNVAWHAGNKDPQKNWNQIGKSVYSLYIFLTKTVFWFVGVFFAGKKNISEPERPTMRLVYI